MNYYETLGISRESSPDEIKKAYRVLVHRYHPDINPGDVSAEEKMKELNFIYFVLSDSNRRNSYNESLDAGEESFNAESYGDSPLYWRDEAVVQDSTGDETTIKVGEFIYFPVTVDKSILGWKRKSKEHEGACIKRIYPRDFCAKPRSNVGNPGKTPLCVIAFGEQEIVVSLEDFRLIWISERNYKKIDTKKGITTALLTIIALAFLSYFLFTHFSLTPEQKRQMSLVTEPINQIPESEKQYYREVFLASDREINYILSGLYEEGDLSYAKVKKDIGLRSAPDSYGLEIGDINAGKEVVILLECETKGCYKVQAGKLAGWIPKKFLEPVHNKGK